MNTPSLKTKTALSVSLLFVFAFSLLVWYSISSLEKSYGKTIATQLFALVSTRSFLLVATMTTIAVMVITWLLMNRLTRPLSTITGRVESALPSNGSQRLAGVNSGDEIGTLTAAFNRMITAMECQQAALRESEEKFATFFQAANLNEARLEALERLNEMADASLHEITNFALEEAVRLTGSTIGYLAFTNEDETILTMYSWPKEAMAECAISDKPIVYPVGSTGLWGEALRQRRSIIINDYAAPNPLKKGYPPGHVQLLRHMNAPIFDGEQIVIVAGVGNKGAAYDEADVRQLSLLMQELWRLVQRKRLTEALSDSERFLSTIIDTEPECVKLLAPDGTLLMMNKAGLAMIGADSLDQVRGQSIYPLVDSACRDAFITLTEGVFQGREGSLEFEITGLTGQRLWLDTHAVPFYNEHGEIISLLAITRDITEHKKAQEALIVKQCQLEQLNSFLEERISSAVNDLRQKDQALIQQSRLAVMGEMINNIAHQWRQPLNNIGLMVQNLGFSIDSGESDKDEARKEVDNVMKNIVFMSNTIDDFRNFFRTDKQRCSFSVNRSVESALAFVGASLKNSNIKVDLTAEDKVTATGYHNEYAQVLLNVIANARDVLMERKISDPGIEIKIFGGEGRSVVTISDNAGGIPDDVLLRIFDPYFTTKEAGKGTGIGLYMSKVIIEHNMRGSLTAYNMGPGAVFRIEI